MTHAIAYIPGQLATSYGPNALPELLAAAGADLSWRTVDWTTAEDTIDALKAQPTDALLMAHRRASNGGVSPIVQLREGLGCYANLRPIRSIPGLDDRFKDINMMVVRECTEDIYAQLEHESIPGVFESLKVTTRSACERIAREAFELARAQNRKKVTIVHKANIMKKSDGLFLATALDVSKDYPEIETDDCIVDALCMKLILYPEWFDVLLCGNLFGDIVADVCAGLVGGRSNCPSANIGPQLSVFTTGHSAENHNDTSLLLSAALMLNHLGQTAPAERLMNAYQSALTNHQDDLLKTISRIVAS